MPRPKREEVPSEEVRRRAIDLIRQAFGSNLRKAAAELGIDQSYLSRLLRGERAAGPTLVAALARHPRVDEGWLVFGRGEPLVPDPAESLPLAGVFNRAGRA